MTNVMFSYKILFPYMLFPVFQTLFLSISDQNLISILFYQYNPKSFKVTKNHRVMSQVVYTDSYLKKKL